MKYKIIFDLMKQIENLEVRILGRWTNSEIEYVFSQNKTFQINSPKSEKPINGFFSISERQIHFTRADYSHQWKGIVEYIDSETLLLKHMSNNILKDYDLKKNEENFTLKQINSTGSTTLLILLSIKDFYYPALLMNKEVETALYYDHFDRPRMPTFMEKKPEKKNELIYFIVFLIIGIIIFFYLNKILGFIITSVGILTIYYDITNQAYNRETKDYQEKEKKFEVQLVKYNMETALNEKEFLSLKNKEKIKSILSKAKFSIGTDYIKGISHEFFLKKLIDHFGNKLNNTKGILESVTHYKNNYADVNNARPYISDFAYINDEIGLTLLIEIDEPYTLNDKEPIHLNDDTRNSFFLELNWVIMRFSEEQILHHASECCNLISEVILEFEEPCDKLRLNNSLPIIQKWDYFNICRLINSNYREKYLKLNQNKLT